eukprot:485116_1
MSTVTFFWLLLLSVCFSQENTFSFSNVHGDYMVLQQAPFKANIWGFSKIENDKISVTLTNTDKNQLIQTINTIATKNNEFNATIWKVLFDPISTSFSNYTISAHSSSLNTTIKLKHILFGDVIVCSGQSNMQIPVQYVINKSEEIQDANNYPFIRIMQVNLSKADVPQIELIKVALNWSITSNKTIPSFSATCWFFGRDLYESLNYPLGLIESAFGGTSIYNWCSPTVLKECNTTKYDETRNWNAMIYPLLQTTIKSVIWYQGEADSRLPFCNYYNCLLKAMINDWRLQWSLKSDTDVLFPFGIVQLSVWNDEQNITCADNVTCTAAAVVRYAQTGNYGYVPNSDMINIFFATAIDLGDPNGPAGDIHPRFKQQVGKRLSNAGLNIIYGESDIYWMGPIADKASYNKSGNCVVINFRNVGENGLEIKNFVGFEVLNAANHWVVQDKSVVTNGNFDVVIALSISSQVLMIRYNWYQAPCLPDEGILNCAIYDSLNQLPAIPFILKIS